MSIASNTQYGIAIVIDPPIAKKFSGIDPSKYIENFEIKLPEAKFGPMNATEQSPIAVSSDNHLAAEVTVGDLVLRPKIQKSLYGLPQAGRNWKRALQDSHVGPISSSIIKMEAIFTQARKSQLCSIEKSLHIVKKLQSDLYKKVGLTASNNFTHPNITLESTLRAIRTNDPARKKKLEDNESFKSSHSFSRLTASQSHLNGEESRSEKAKLHCDKCKKVVYNASKIITKPNLELKNNKKYAAILKRRLSFELSGAAVVINTNPIALVFNEESRSEKAKLTSDYGKNKGHTASNYFTKPNASKKAENKYEGILEKHSTVKLLGQELAINANATVLTIQSEIAVATDDIGNFLNLILLDGGSNQSIFTKYCRHLFLDLHSLTVKCQISGIGGLVQIKVIHKGNIKFMGQLIPDVYYCDDLIKSVISE